MSHETRCVFVGFSRLVASACGFLGAQGKEFWSNSGEEGKDDSWTLRPVRIYATLHILVWSDWY